MTVPPMRIQVDGVNWILSQYNSGAGGILGDEMGLGKTIQTLAFISALKVRSKLSGVPRVSTDTGVSRGSPGLYRYRAPSIRPSDAARPPYFNLGAVGPGGRATRPALGGHAAGGVD